MLSYLSKNRKILYIIKNIIHYRFRKNTRHFLLLTYFTRDLYILKEYFNLLKSLVLKNSGTIFMEKEIKNCRKTKSSKSYFLKGLVVFGIMILILLLSFTHRKAEDIPLYSNNLFTPVYYAGCSSEQADKIALIRIEGIISNTEDSWWDATTNANNISDQLYNAENNPSIKAVILYIDSPGGEITAVEKIHHHIKNIEKKGKKVIALMDSIAASGGYYISAGCDKIIAGKLTITGSIGVIIDSYKYYNLLNKIGVQDEIYKTGEFKDLLNPARPSTPKEQELIKNMLNESYEDFIQVVSMGRKNQNKNLTVEYIKNSIVGDGRVFSGQEALVMGLVDRLGYYSDAVDEAIHLAKLDKKNVQIISYESKVGISDIINRLLYKKFKINLEIPGVNRNAHVKPGSLYFLYPGAL